MNIQEKPNYSFSSKKTTIIRMIEVTRENIEIEEKLSKFKMEIGDVFKNDLCDFILDLMGFPQEDSTGWDPETGEPLNPDGFCRDFYKTVISYRHFFSNEPIRSAKEVYDFLKKEIKEIRKIKKGDINNENQDQ